MANPNWKKLLCVGLESDLNGCKGIKVIWNTFSVYSGIKIEMDVMSK